MRKIIITVLIVSVLTVFACDMSVVEKAIKELKVDPGKTQTSSLTMSLGWQDAEGNAISWPDDVAGVKFQLLQKKNGGEEKEYGDKIVFTAESPSRKLENITINSPDGTGKTDNYTYTVKKPTSGRYAVSVSDMSGSIADGFRIAATIKKPSENYQDPQNPQAGDPEVIIIEVDESEPNFQLFNMRATTNKIYDSSTYWQYNLQGLIDLFKNQSAIGTRSASSGYALTGVYKYNYEEEDGSDENHGDSGTAQGGIKQRMTISDTNVTGLHWLYYNTSDRRLINAVFGTSTAIPTYSLTGPSGNYLSINCPSRYYPTTVSCSYLSGGRGAQPYPSQVTTYITWTRTNVANTQANWNTIYTAFDSLKAFTSSPGIVAAEVFKEYSADEEVDFGYSLNIKENAVENNTSTLVDGEQVFPATTFYYSRGSWSRSNSDLGTADWLQKGYVFPFNSEYGVESKGHIEKTTVSLSDTQTLQIGPYTGRRSLIKRKGLTDYRRIRDISFSVGNFEVTDVQINPDLVYNYVRSGSNFFVILKEDQIPYGGQLGWVIKVTLSAKGQSETKTISIIKE